MPCPRDHLARPHAARPSWGKSSNQVAACGAGGVRFHVKHHSRGVRSVGTNGRSQSDGQQMTTALGTGENDSRGSARGRSEKGSDRVIGGVLGLPRILPAYPNLTPRHRSVGGRITDASEGGRETEGQAAPRTGWPGNASRPGNPPASAPLCGAAARLLALSRNRGLPTDLRRNEQTMIMIEVNRGVVSVLVLSEPFSWGFEMAGSGGFGQIRRLTKHPRTGNQCKARGT